MSKVFAATFGVTLVSILGIFLIDLQYPKFWMFAILPYLWMMVGVAGIAPVSLIVLLIPQARRHIGGRLLILNIVSVGVLLFLVDKSKSVLAMMHI